MPACTTHPLREAMSIHPGHDAIYAPGRSIDDHEQSPPVLIAPATADETWCWECWFGQFRRGLSWGII